MQKSVGLYFAGLKSAAFVGIITGFFAFIPYVGIIIGASAAFALAVEQFSTWSPIWHLSGGQFNFNTIFNWQQNQG